VFSCDPKGFVVQVRPSVPAFEMGERPETPIAIQDDLDGRRSHRNAGEESAPLRQCKASRVYENTSIGYLSAGCRYIEGSLLIQGLSSPGSLIVFPHFVFRFRKGRKKENKRKIWPLARNSPNRVSSGIRIFKGDFGGRQGIRTPGLIVANDALSQLS
jgi:hypothetical protein